MCFLQLGSSSAFLAMLPTSTCRIWGLLIKTLAFDMTLTQPPYRSVSSSEQPDSKDQPSETTRFFHLGWRHWYLHHPTAALCFSLMDVPSWTLLNSSPPSLPPQSNKSEWGKRQTWNSLLFVAGSISMMSKV